MSRYSGEQIVVKNRSWVSTVIVMGVLIVAALFIMDRFAGIFKCSGFDYFKHEETTGKVTNSEMFDIQEYAVKEEIITGKLKWSEGYIPFLTKTGFSMKYDVIVKAGIDMSKAKITETGDKIEIKLPHAEIFSASLDVETLKFFSEKKALFNHKDLEDYLLYMRSAEVSAKQEAIDNGLLTETENRVKNLFYMHYAPIASGKTIVISFYGDDIQVLAYASMNE